MITMLGAYRCPGPRFAGVFAALVLVAACGMNSSEMIDSAKQALTEEQIHFDNLKKNAEKLTTLDVGSEEWTATAQNNLKLLDKYAGALHAFQQFTAKALAEKPENIQKEVTRIHTDAKDKRKNRDAKEIERDRAAAQDLNALEIELPPIIQKFYARSAKVTLFLAPWDLEQVDELIADVHMLKRNENIIRVRFEPKMRDLINKYVLPEKTGEPRGQIPVESQTTIEVAVLPLLDTLEECRRLVDEFLDPYCREDAYPACSHQTNLDELKKRVLANKEQKCRSGRKRETSAFYVDSKKTYAWWSSMGHAYNAKSEVNFCKSKTAIFKN